MLAACAASFAMMIAMMVAMMATVMASTAWAQSRGCNLTGTPSLVWYGREHRMPVAKLAALSAPVIWFSPDEPLLERREGAAIRIPEAFPFEPPAADRPVLYYQIEDVLTRGSGSTDNVVARDASHLPVSIDLSRVQAMNISFYAYFPSEEGIGAHPHDVEPAEFRVAALTRDEAVEHGFGQAASCPDDMQFLVLVRATGKAHGLVFYWNVLDSDKYIRMPITLLVEEGKHALATDKNGDGVFTPGYDVNRRVNDAWGVRDIARTGTLYAGGYELWMAKTRRPEHRIFPPLPDDSPQRVEMDSMMTGRQYATYELRMLPPLHAAKDPAVEHLLVGKSIEGWPVVHAFGDALQLAKWVEEGAAINSLSVAAQYDGKWGVAWSFPFFVVHHLTNPMNGGYILQRMYLRGHGLDDFGWQALSTRSASRWIDSYLAAGAERLVTTDSLTLQATKKWDFVFEGGAKFRVNLQHAPMPVSLLSKITPFWGTRLGIRSRGGFDVNRIRYVVEFGAGSF
jgi:hypothetical protein